MDTVEKPETKRPARANTGLQGPSLTGRGGGAEEEVGKEMVAEMPAPDQLAWSMDKEVENIYWLLGITLRDRQWLENVQLILGPPQRKGPTCR